MKTRKQHFTCDCGQQIDISDNPAQVKCHICNKVYGRLPPKLLFMGVQEEQFPAGTIIF